MFDLGDVQCQDDPGVREGWKDSGWGQVSPSIVTPIMPKGQRKPASVLGSDDSFAKELLGERLCLRE